ncbi:MAG: thiamine ABC transporter substrate-binding protein [Acidimicrobiia bacterium]|nr:thiamine ABC transporter substrate-binding protein [Acidimicrobiia bacterium]MDH4306364.1 thiamine ABC transporter substrate-binding protein [Acidimicrobiia bacterium]MDH5293191.1 thiamine ABC transporter substrate-binding protein [Acidimicrobiia bacterium]
MSKRLAASLLVVGMTLVACAGEETTSATGGDTPESIRVVTHDSFAAGVNDDTFAGFTAETGIEVEVFPAGDAGAMVNQLVLTKDDPIGDVVFGVDDTFLSRALEADVFTVHESKHLPDVDPSLQLDPEHRVTPIDFGDVCINYDKAEVSIPPSSLDDLLTEDWTGTLVVENPATSSPGLAFLLATIAEYGDPGFEEYWQGLVANGVEVVGDWDTAYYASFTRYGGERPLVVSYASSPPAEVVFAEEPLSEAPTGVMLDGCYRQIEFAGVLEGTGREGPAGQLVDFMLSPEFQAQIPLTWFVFPANTTVELPPEFVDHTTLPEAPASVDAAEIDTNRERWIETWTDIVLG